MSRSVACSVRSAAEFEIVAQFVGRNGAHRNVRISPTATDARTYRLWRIPTQAAIGVETSHCNAVAIGMSRVVGTTVQPSGPEGLILSTALVWGGADSSIFRRSPPPELSPLLAS
jgi:hypothetical protein